jgi:hypothetical protein
MSQKSTWKQFAAALERPNGASNWTYLFVPFNVEAEYGSRGRVAMRGTIDGEGFRGSSMPRGDGRHFVVVNQTIRKTIGKEAPAEVMVELDRDEAPRVVTVPELLSTALFENPAAKAVFDRLSYSHQKEYADSIEDAKKAETKGRRVAKAIDMLLAGQGVKAKLPRA